MSYKLVYFNSVGPSLFQGLSTDTKPTTTSHPSLKIDDIAVETDGNGDKYEYRGSMAGWVNVDSGGTMLVQTSSTSTDSKGNYPARDWLPGSATGIAAGTIYGPVVHTPYNRLTVQISALTATSIDVYASIDGTNFAPVRLKDASTGALFAATAINATGIYILEGKYAEIRIDQVGAGGATINTAHWTE